MNAWKFRIWSGRQVVIDIGNDTKIVSEPVAPWLENSAQLADSKVIRLECRTDNTNAIAFYQYLGYRQAGRVRAYCDQRVDAARLIKHPVAGQ